MESLPQPDSHLRPRRPESHRPGTRRARRALPPATRAAVAASRGCSGSLVGDRAGTLGLDRCVIAVVFAAAGVDDLDDNEAFTFVATFAGDLALVAAAWGITASRCAPADAAHVRLPPLPIWPAIGWSLLAFFGYLVLAGVYTSSSTRRRTTCPTSSAPTRARLLAVITGVFVIGVAPLGGGVLLSRLPVPVAAQQLGVRRWRRSAAR